MQKFSPLIATIVLIGGCLADQATPSTEPSPLGCEPTQVELVAGDWGGAAGTTILNFTAELREAPPCLVLTNPSVEISDSSGAVIAQGTTDPGDATALLSTVVEFELGWASWCGVEPNGPFTASIGLLEEGAVPMLIDNGFGPSACNGGSMSLTVWPGW